MVSIRRLIMEKRRLAKLIVENIKIRADVVRRLLDLCRGICLSWVDIAPETAGYQVKRLCIFACSAILDAN